MVSEDDHCRDTFPPLSLSQVLRIVPHLLVLCTYQTPIPLRLATSHNDYSLGRSWRRAASIAKTRYLMRARAWTPWELKFVMGVTTTSLHSLGAQELCGGAHGRHFQGDKTTLGWPTKGGPRHPVFPWCVHLFPAREDNFRMLAFLQKDRNGALEIALLSYCAFF